MVSNFAVRGVAVIADELLRMVDSNTGIINYVNCLRSGDSLACLGTGQEVNNTNISKEMCGKHFSSWI